MGSEASITFLGVGDARWNECAAIRRTVFVEGQDCPEDEEFDRFDAEARHLLLRRDGRPVATARWRVVAVEDAGRDGARWAKLERFAVLDSERGRGLGRHLVAASLADARAAGHARFRLHAQSHLCGFYESFGFRAVGPPFVEAGIEHRLMIALDDARRADETPPAVEESSTESVSSS